MSKELPFFKFYPSEWFEGDITLQNEKTQGLFILICAWYWKKDCVIDINFVHKRLIVGKASLKQCLNNLIEAEIIKIDDSQRIIINFLDKQYDELSEKRKKFVEAGRKGGKASLKHRRSIKDKEVDKEEDKDINIIIDYLNDKTGKNYKSSSRATRDKIKARMNEGFNIDDFKKVIDNKVSEWKGTEMDKYLRPETLFSPKFESYLNQKPKTDSTRIVAGV